MAKKDPVIKTKRLIISPMSDLELGKIIAVVEDPELKKAYEEMLEGCHKDPKMRIWYTAWKICLKKTGEMVGDLGFKGTPQNHAVEIGYGICEEDQMKGYCTEAVNAVMDWACNQGQGYVCYIEAEADDENKASIRVLEKAGFKPYAIGEEGTRYVYEKPAPRWMTIYMLFGLAIGMSVGSALGSLVLGMAPGMLIGMAIGAWMDVQTSKQRVQIRDERNKRLTEKYGDKLLS